MPDLNDYSTIGGVAAAPFTGGLSMAIPAITSLLGSIFGSNSNNRAAEEQAKQTLWGNQQQRAYGTQVYNNDLAQNYEAGQWLQKYLPQLDMTKQQAPTLPNQIDPNQYFGDSKVNQYYDTAQSNLTRDMNTSIGNAQSSAGASAASRGIANPSAMLSMVGNQAGQNFIPQFGKLEESRVGALLGNQQNLYNAMFQQGQTNFGNQMNLANFNSGQNQQMNQLRQMQFGNYANFANQYGDPSKQPNWLGGTRNSTLG